MSLRALGERTGIPYGCLSLVERGLMIPRDEWIGEIERAYGVTYADWYPSAGIAVILLPDRDAAARGET